MMNIRSIGFDTLTFVLATKPDFMNGHVEHDRFMSKLEAGSLFDRVSSKEDGSRRRPAYGQTVISTKCRGLFVTSNPQMTSVNCSVPGLMDGHNINGFPIERMHEFTAEVSNRLGVDASKGRVTRLDLCVNVDSSLLLTDFIDRYNSNDKRYNEILFDRSTKYVKCKSKENALYSQIHRYKNGSDAHSIVREYLDANHGLTDMIRWELKLRKPAFRRDRTTLADLDNCTQNDWLVNQYTDLVSVVGINDMQRPAALSGFRIGAFDGLRQFKLWCVQLGIKAYGQERLLNLLYANRQVMDRKVFHGIKELLERTSVPDVAGAIESPAALLKEIVANGIDECFR